MTMGGRMRPPGSGSGAGSGSGSGSRRGFGGMDPNRLRQIFWQIVNRELAAAGTSLTGDGSEAMDRLIGRGVRNFQSVTFAQTLVNIAEKHLADFMVEVIQEAASLGQSRVTSEAIEMALSAAKKKGWSFWPFS